MRGGDFRLWLTQMGQPLKLYYSNILVCCQQAASVFNRESFELVLFVSGLCFEAKSLEPLFFCFWFMFFGLQC